MNELEPPQFSPQSVPLEWTCHICNRRRPDEMIHVAKHLIEDANGVVVEDNVRYCVDNPVCMRLARIHNHADIALKRERYAREGLEQMLDIYQGEQMDPIKKFLTGLAFGFGFGIAVSVAFL